MSNKKTAKQLTHTPDLLANRPVIAPLTEPLAPPSRREHILGLIFIGWGITLWLVCAYFFPINRMDYTPLIVIISLFLVTAIHEMGHLIADLWFGFYPSGVQVGPILTRKYFHGWKTTVSSWPFWGGSVTSIPPLDQPAAVISRRQLFTVAAGPATQIGSVALLLPSYTLLTNPNEPTIFSEIIFWLIYCSLLILPLSLIPNILPWMRNDATLFLEYWRSPGENERDWLNRLHWATWRGQRPREFSPDWLAQGLQESDKDWARQASFWNYIHALDSEDPKRAANHLDQCLAAIVARPDVPLWTGCLMEAAYMEARYGRHPEIAREWLELTRRHLPDYQELESEQAFLRAEATVLWAEGRIEEATNAAQRSLALLSQFTDIGNARAEEAWLKELLKRISEE